MASPDDESALPAVAALGISTSPVTPLAEQFPEQVRGIEEEVLALVERWPDATEYLDYVYLADDDRGHPHHAVGGSYGVGRARDGTVRSRGIKIKPSRLGFPSSFITGGILLEQLTGEELTERTMVANASWQTWRRMVGDEAADLSETEFPVSAEQIDRASRLIIIHELGHAVGEAAIPLTQGGGGRAREKKYEALLRKYGITPEEIASVSEYATTSPAEAFAEIYSMMFSEMADGMDPDLREKFSRLLRERLPEHQIPDFSRESAILTA